MYCAGDDQYSPFVFCVLRRTQITSVGRNIAVNWWFNTHSFVLDSVYQDWIESLPQSEWGMERLRQQEMEMQEANSRAGNDGYERDEL